METLFALLAVWLTGYAALLLLAGIAPLFCAVCALVERNTPTKHKPSAMPHGPFLGRRY